MDTALEAKRKTSSKMKQQAREHLITIFGDKLKLVPSHAERRSREINRQINRQIRADKRKRRRVYQILLLGPESARAEVFNLFRKKCGKTFSEAERRDAKVAVLRRTIMATKCLLEHLECLSIVFEQKSTSSDAQPLDDDEIGILRTIERLWNDSFFQALLNESTECLALLKEVSFFKLKELEVKAIKS